MKIPYLEIYDFETTDLFNPEPTQVGVVAADEDLEVVSANSEYIKPKGDISFSAMGLTGITPETVKDAEDAETVLARDNYIAPDEESKYIAAYNWNFDKQFIPESWLVGKKIICLLKLAKTFVDKDLTGDHKLSTLWYYFGHYKTKNYGQAHEAKTDCLMALDVLKSILSENNLTLDQAWEILYDVKTCKGGKKYKGEKWEEVIRKDYDYVEHTFNNVELDQDELDYLKELLSENEYIKLEQVKICKKARHLNKDWATVLEEDPDYIDFLSSKGYLSEGELAYIESLVEA